ncbi:MAG TPA: helix-turn-helix transcriptional regulator [Candidatus Dormibacteraeota bacterium]
MTRRGRRGPGIPIIPSRVRLARTERGLSLADLAGSEVSRAFIHQLEQGLARPSLEILELIAQRTGKSVSYFTHGDLDVTGVPDLSSDLVATSKRLERLASTLDLTDANREAFRMVVNTLRHGARLITAVTHERRGRDHGAQPKSPSPPAGEPSEPAKVDQSRSSAEISTR